VLGVEKIITVPTKLESTSLVIALGLDIFITRTSPSKGFDTLSNDFSYSGLILTIICLVSGIAAAKHYVFYSDLRPTKRISEMRGCKVIK
jgi:ER membrane protein complex subunit 1